MPGGRLPGIPHHGGRAWELEVEAGLTVLHARGGHGVDVTLAQQDIPLGLQLDLRAVLGVEEHAVLDLDLTDVGTGGHDGSPRKPLADTGRRRDHDAAAGAPFAALT